MTACSIHSTGNMKDVRIKVRGFSSAEVLRTSSAFQHIANQQVEGKVFCELAQCPARRIRLCILQS